MPEPLDARERRELCDLFGDLGSEAPTLCEGWATKDLAAHLVVRERNPVAAPGILLGGPFERMLERAMARALTQEYDRLVEKVRNGPPLGPFAVPGLRTLVNLNEYAVHHEDVRRANGLGPRTDRPDLQAALWSVLRRGARFQLRRVKGVVVRLATPDGDEVVVGSSGATVSVEGEPLELVLYLFGRRGAAVVELLGDPDSVAILERTELGI